MPRDWLAPAIAVSPRSFRGDTPCVLLGARTGFPRDRTIPQLFAARAAATPDARAIVDADEVVTYRELDERSSVVARALAREHVGPGGIVGVLANPSAETIAAYLGALKAGSAYLPLDPANPPERIARMLGSCEAALLLAPDALASPFASDGVLTFEALRQGGEERFSLQALTADPLAPAYVMYTSGSTGEPKGIRVPHRAITRLVCDTDYVRIGADDVVAQVSNLSFDASTFEIWGALLNGACLARVDKTVLLSTGELRGALARAGATVAFLTTALVHHHVRSDPAVFAGLRALLFGGEVADPKLVRRLLEAGPPKELLHVYGPTETTTFATWHVVSSIAADAASIPIGRPIANTSAYVLDAQRRPVAIGEVGSLYVGGDGVALGYVGAPARDAERFLPDPFWGEPGARMYATGDLVRVLDGGSLEFVGRDDDQIKVSGYRVELGEVESVLRRHPAVVDAAVIATADAHGQKQLEGFVVLAGEVSDGDLRAHVSRCLPAYMAPRELVRLAALPLSANGKVDRRALAMARRGAQSDVVPAERGVHDERERRRTVAERIWCEVLGVERVGASGDFLALGGHSLRAMQIVARARDALGLELSVRTLYETPVFGAWFAAHVAGASVSDDEALLRALAEVEALGDDEVARELAEGDVG